jgi:hypothetical protein
MHARLATSDINLRLQATLHTQANGNLSHFHVHSPAPRWESPGSYEQHCRAACGTEQHTCRQCLNLANSRHTAACNVAATHHRGCARSLVAHVPMHAAVRNAAVKRIALPHLGSVSNAHAGSCYHMLVQMCSEQHADCVPQLRMHAGAPQPAASNSQRTSVAQVRQHAGWRTCTCAPRSASDGISSCCHPCGHAGLTITMCRLRLSWPWCKQCYGGET